MRVKFAFAKWKSTIWIFPPFSQSSHIKTLCVFLSEFLEQQNRSASLSGHWALHTAHCTLPAYVPSVCDSKVPLTHPAHTEKCSGNSQSCSCGHKQKAKTDSCHLGQPIPDAELCAGHTGLGAWSVGVTPGRCHKLVNMVNKPLSQRTVGLCRHLQHESLVRHRWSVGSFISSHLQGCGNMASHLCVVSYSSYTELGFLWVLKFPSPKICSRVSVQKK